MILREDGLDIDKLKLQESLFAQGNGYIGIRGNLEETSLTVLEGNYINGFYETAPIRYEEDKVGFARKSETMLNVTAAKSFSLTVNDEVCEVIEHKRELNMKTGLLTRVSTLKSPTGNEVVINTNRLVSFTDKNIIAITYEVTAKNFTGKVEIKTGIDGNVSNVTRANDSRVGTNLPAKSLMMRDWSSFKDGIAMEQRTNKTRKSVCCAVKFLIDETHTTRLANTSFASHPKVRTMGYSCKIKEGETVKLIKFIAYTTTTIEKAQALVESAAQKGFSYFKESQRKYLMDFWENANITINGNEELQRSVHFGIFSLLQGAGRDGRTSIAAKGLSGEGYQGHYFWESETYMLPVFVYTCPDIAKGILMYRYSILNNARKLAKEHLLQGAMYPWRTISGAESSPYYPAGTAQYHITGGVAYAVKLYYEVTGDEDFLKNYGAEMLFETARMWLSLGHFNQRKGSEKYGKFCIDSVTGPDEYTTVVNNNCYTNISAAENMQMAADVYNKYGKEFASKFGVTEEEAQNWQRAAKNIFLPYDNELEIYMQDDSFLDKKPWDLTAHKGKLVMDYAHPLQMYRAQVCKQADLILAQLLFPHRFSKVQIARDYEYYEPLTSHDSSLSECVFSMVAARIGKRDEAMRFFMRTAFTDINNTHNNTQDGLHMATMAGTWLCIIYGFAGFVWKHNCGYFEPQLPDDWDGYSFCLRLKGCRLKVDVKREEVTYTLVEGEALTFFHFHEECIIKNGESVVKR